MGLIMAKVTIETEDGTVSFTCRCRDVVSSFNAVTALVKACIGFDAAINAGKDYRSPFCEWVIEGLQNDCHKSLK